MVDKIKQWIDHGFTYDEAALMVKGSTQADSHRRHGGVWYVGYIPYYQAASAAHAEKMYTYRFKEEVKAHFVAAPKKENR